MIRRFAGYFRPHMALFLLDMGAALLLSLCDLLFPVATRTVINVLIPGGDVGTLMTWFLALFVVYLFKMGMQYFVNYWGHVMGVRMQADMRREMFQKLEKLPFSYYDENKTGAIMSRMLNDLMNVSELAHHGPENIFISAIEILGAFVIMATMDWKLTLILFVAVPLFILCTLLTRRKMNLAFLQSKVEVAEINATLENSISGIRVAKAFTSSKGELEKFEKGNKAFVSARSKAYKAMAEYHSWMNYVIDLLRLIVLVAGGYFAIRGQIDVGEFAAFLLYVNVFVTPIRRLVDFMEQLQDGMTGFERLCEVLDAEEEKESPTARDIAPIQGEISFEGVSFRYDDNSEILSGIDLHIPKGETLALVGPSGGGKTTLCHLLPRFYDVDAGRIAIDGIDIREYTLDSLRRGIGIVQQDVFLFTGTIRENIAYGNPDASQSAIEEAARRARILEFILSLPDGYDTYVGERGVKLSGGQKQRISIARVFLKNPPILILDEATSALDNTTELLIQQSLDELCHGRTTLVVAHRLSTIKNADEIVVLTGEGILERGTHDQLLARQGLYASLYQSQFRGL